MQVILDETKIKVNIEHFRTTIELLKILGELSPGALSVTSRLITFYEIAIKELESGLLRS